MRSKKEGKRRSSSSSPARNRTIIVDSGGFEQRRSPSRSSNPSTVPRATSLLDTEIVTEGFEERQIYPDYRNPNPRSFPYSVKQQCWEKAEKIKGRDPERWRRDPLGNIVFRKLVGCPGCLCHDYDHIIPYSKGGQSTLENCQVLQATVNRSKGNKTEISKADLIQKSSYCRVAGREMDLLELSAYGNVRRGQDSGGCRIQ
ncbi:HNH endonuclease [Macleaya cordata]|uniref:HNH endonuclease n=1 Tax=Macleaya cordata TaxID=56857 RepID=A0A200QER8_MACCD|nr:HNH endonuclease [Macleaya cordata]